MMSMHLKAHVELDFSFLVSEKTTIELNFSISSVFQPLALWRSDTFTPLFNPENQT